MKHEQVIYGTPPSKSNSYRIITVKGKNGKSHGSLGKTDAMKKWEQQFYMQCGAYRNMKIKNFFELYLDVYLPSQRQDLDNILKGCLDCLQSCKAIDNDRYCVKIVAQKFIDPVQPRIEFTLKEVEGIQVKKSKEPSLFDDD